MWAPHALTCLPMWGSAPLVTLLGTERQGCMSVCCAALWGGEGACRADFVSPGRQLLLPWFLGLFSLPR